MAEHDITFYADPDEPLVVEWSPDGIFWERTTAYDVRPIEGCDVGLVRKATVDVESGWVRTRYLFGNPAQFDSTSNQIAVPEPMSVGLFAGLILLSMLMRRRGRAC